MEGKEKKWVGIKGKRDGRVGRETDGVGGLTGPGGGPVWPPNRGGG